MLHQSRLTFKSDARNPQAIIEQICAIAPILPGQVSRAPSQPSNSQGMGGVPQQRVQQQGFQQQGIQQQGIQQQGIQQQSMPQQGVQQQRAPQPQQGQPDLIDFGQRDARNVPAPRQQQGPPSMAGLSLREPLAPRVTRHDSVEGQDEEFVDAES